MSVRVEHVPRPVDGAADELLGPAVPFTSAARDADVLRPMPNIDATGFAPSRSASSATLIVQGSEDRCTPLGQGQVVYAGLVERGVESELVFYPREGHGLREDSHRRDFWRRAVAWFDRHLRPDHRTG